jgi:hypothetical protein
MRTVPYRLLQLDCPGRLQFSSVVLHAQVALPGEEPPPSNYIPMGPCVLEQKLAQRHNDSSVHDLLHTFSTRCGLRVSLRWDRHYV